MLARPLQTNGKTWLSLPKIFRSALPLGCIPDKYYFAFIFHLHWGTRTIGKYTQWVRRFRPVDGLFLPLQIMIRSIFLFLDRTYVLQNSMLPSIWWVWEKSHIDFRLLSTLSSTVYGSFSFLLSWLRDARSWRTGGEGTFSCRADVCVFSLPLPFIKHCSLWQFAAFKSFAFFSGIWG